MDQQDLVARVQDLVEGSKQLDRLLDTFYQAVASSADARSQQDALSTMMAVANELTSTTRSMIAATRSMTAISHELIGRSRATAARAQEVISHVAQRLPATIPTFGARWQAPGLDVRTAIRPMFAKLASYSHLTGDEQDALSDAVSLVHCVPSGTDLATQGSCPSESAVLLDGFAARCKLLANGRRQITTLHVPGDFVDLQSFLLKPLDHSITALTGCRVALVPHEALQRVIDTRLSLARLLWFSTLVDGAIQREWLVVIGRQSCKTRLAHLLCELLIRLRVVGLTKQEGGVHTFLLPLTQADVGDMLGMTSVHVSRTLRELRQEGLATWSGGTVSILDWPCLVHAGEFDPSYLHLSTEKQPLRGRGEPAVSTGAAAVSHHAASSS